MKFFKSIFFIITSFLFLFLFSNSMVAQDNCVGFSIAMGANKAIFYSFPNEEDVQAKFGHSLSADMKFGKKFSIDPGLTLRHYKNKSTVADSIENEMSVDLLNIHLLAEAVLVQTNCIKISVLGGIGMDYNFKIKSSVVSIDLNNFDKYMTTSIMGLKIGYEKLFFLLNWDRTGGSFLKLYDYHSQIYEFKIGYIFF